MILHGDSLEVLKTLPENSVDAVVTDPPYGWRFMGKAWDKFDIDEKAKRGPTTAQKSGDFQGPNRGISTRSASAGEYDLSAKANWNFMLWTQDWATEILRVLKPGGHMVVFCGPRTYHAMAMGVEQAGFEIRDQLQWIFGSGFPKSLNLGNGFGTALKPANEPIVLARKPLSESTVAKNVLRWNCGALNIDGSRIGMSDADVKATTRSGEYGETTPGIVGFTKTEMRTPINTQCRWPANLLICESVAADLDVQNPKEMPSRYFYCAKSSKSERNAGLEGMPLKVSGGMSGTLDGTLKTGSGNERNNLNQNSHPTVKPIKLMEYLCKLITPPGGTVLDPFCGSGSTGVAAVRLGFKFIGIEREAEYVAIAEKRIEHAKVDEEVKETDPQTCMSI